MGPLRDAVSLGASRPPASASEKLDRPYEPLIRPFLCGHTSGQISEGRHDRPWGIGEHVGNR